MDHVTNNTEHLDKNYRIITIEIYVSEIRDTMGQKFSKHNPLYSREVVH
jgi:hypothetical protein